MSFHGRSLHPAQRLNLRNALLTLQINEKLTQKPRFWGQITGRDNDYFIVQTITTAEHFTKQFYFSYNGCASFSALPEVDAWIIERCRRFRGTFKGDPAFLYKEPKYNEEGELIEDEEDEEEPEEEEPEEEDEDASSEGGDREKPKKMKAIDPSKRKLKEVERLANVVNEIERHTCVLPKRALLLTPLGQIIPNLAFRGLSAVEARKLSSYVLQRNPERHATLLNVGRITVENNPDFLDSVLDPDSPTPEGVWSLHISDSGAEVTLRNLEWPGFEFQTQVDSKAYASAYFGTGEKNDDVMFMLPPNASQLAQLKATHPEAVAILHHKASLLPPPKKPLPKPKEDDDGGSPKAKDKQKTATGRK